MGMLRGVVVAVLALDALLLALTEMAWISLRAGDVPLPIAALLAALTTPVLVLGADAAMPRSRAPMLVLAAWVVPVAVVGFWSPTGAGVMPPDWRAILLVAAGLIPGMVAATRRPADFPSSPNAPAPGIAAPDSSAPGASASGAPGARGPLAR